MNYNFYALYPSIVKALSNNNRYNAIKEEVTLLHGIYYFYGLENYSDEQHLIGGPYKIAVVLLLGLSSGQLYTFCLKSLLNN